MFLQILRGTEYKDFLVHLVAEKYKLPYNILNKYKILLLNYLRTLTHRTHTHQRNCKDDYGKRQSFWQNCRFGTKTKNPLSYAKKHGTITGKNNNKNEEDEEDEEEEEDEEKENDEEEDDEQEDDEQEEESTDDEEEEKQKKYTRE